MKLAFDADVLIYASQSDHYCAVEVERLVLAARPAIGSVVLQPEVLIKPVRRGWGDHVVRLQSLLGRLDLLATTPTISLTAVALGAKYGLKAADSIHLATALEAGADVFVTNNIRDFADVSEIKVWFPCLADPGAVGE